LEKFYEEVFMAYSVMIKENDHKTQSGQTINQPRIYHGTV
jgi:hypothetical protein